MIRLTCDGASCREWVSKETARHKGWVVVLLYPLVDDEGPTKRRHLCRVCARRLRGFFK